MLLLLLLLLSVDEIGDSCPILSNSWCNPTEWIFYQFLELQKSPSNYRETEKKHVHMLKLIANTEWAFGMHNGNWLALCEKWRGENRFHAGQPGWHQPAFLWTKTNKADRLKCALLTFSRPLNRFRWIHLLHALSHVIIVITYFYCDFLGLIWLAISLTLSVYLCVCKRMFWCAKYMQRH